jgi:hypothetical protein
MTSCSRSLRPWVRIFGVAAAANSTIVATMKIAKRTA